MLCFPKTILQSCLTETDMFPFSPTLEHSLQTINGESEILPEDHFNKVKPLRIFGDVGIDISIKLKAIII